MQTKKELVKRNIAEKVPKIFVNLAKILLNPTRTECMRKPEYVQDGLVTLHTCNFRKDPKFIKAKNSARKTIKPPKFQYNCDWRLHTALWVADHCSHLEGDFVECGVNEGFLSRAIVDYVDFNKLNKKFYLLDTYDGLPLEYATKRELKISAHANKEMSHSYKGTYEKAKKTFEGYKNVQIVKGKIPGTLKLVKSKKVAYLSIDMNLAYPEIKAAEFFWDKMVGGGMILLDDYAFSRSYDVQRVAFDKFAKEKGVKILTLATGQGLIVKPFKARKK